MAKTDDEPTTRKWFRLSELPWGEQRIHDTLFDADQQDWRCDQREQRWREMVEAAGFLTFLTVDAQADRATFHVRVGGKLPGLWEQIHLERVELLLPVDAVEASVGGPPDATDAIEVVKGVARFVYDYMKKNPPEPGDRTYVRTLHERALSKFPGTELKTVQNYVTDYRPELAPHTVQRRHKKAPQRS